MADQELTPEELEAYQEAQEDAADDSQEEQLENTQEYQEAYGSPEPEEKHNQHTFLANAIKKDDSIKVTYLDEWELGRPMFSIRFLLDMEDIAKHYLDEMATGLSDEDKIIINKVADYFRKKIDNITSSGMSKEGFTMNLNVTKKMDTMRKKVRVNTIENIKGGKRRR